MNKKTILAYVLIGLVIIGYFKLNQKSPEDIQREKARQERIAQKKQQEMLAEQERAYRLQQQFESIKNDSTNIFHNIYNGVEIVPIQFLKAVLPDPKSLGANYTGQTSIGCRIRGIKDGKERTYYIYNNCDHEEAFKETGTQAVSFTTGVPAALGASMWAKGLWRGAGVFNVEEFDPDPFLAELGEQGLPWHELFDVDIEV